VAATGDWSIAQYSGLVLWEAATVLARWMHRYAVPVGGLFGRAQVCFIIAVCFSSVVSMLCTKAAEDLCLSLSQRVLEIGAGTTGLPGLTAWRLVRCSIQNHSS